MTDREKIKLLVAVLAWYAKPGGSISKLDLVILRRYAGRAAEVLKAVEEVP